MALRIGVTLGDPCGIGPEIIIQALARLPAGAQVSVIGDLGVLDRAGGLPSGVELDPVTTLAAAESQPGRPSPQSGRAQVAYLERAVDRLRSGELQALVTAPISKAAVYAAGFRFPGHTEFLADAFGVVDPVMMLAGPRLRVALATIHVPLAEVPGRLTPAALDAAIGRTAFALLTRFGIARPRVAVCGLNPHAGEGGALGQEEQSLIEPAVRRAAERLGAYVELSGPHVPDAVFRRAADGEFDAVVALYHDQGLIPVKLLDFDEAVNLTLGLPFVRTSPDHGVAYDVAGTGRARATSMAEALSLCAELAGRPVEKSA
jgi:4-hydroxythreonine-4-phosphate dehydrogenase